MNIVYTSIHHFRSISIFKYAWIHAFDSEFRKSSKSFNSNVYIKYIRIPTMYIQDISFEYFAHLIGRTRFSTYLSYILDLTSIIVCLFFLVLELPNWNFGMCFFCCLHKFNSLSGYFRFCACTNNTSAQSTFTRISSH